MKLFGLIAGSVLLGIVIAASIKPDEGEMKDRRFKKLRRTGLI